MEKLVKVIDEYGVYNLYSELGEKFETDKLKFNSGKDVYDGQVLHFITEVQHPMYEKYEKKLMVCYDADNNIIIMDKNCVIFTDGLIKIGTKFKFKKPIFNTNISTDKIFTILDSEEDRAVAESKDEDNKAILIFGINQYTVENEIDILEDKWSNWKHAELNAKSIMYRTKGLTTEVKYLNEKGYSKCMESDNYDLAIGLEIALERAIINREMKILKKSQRKLKELCE